MMKCAQLDFTYQIYCRVSLILLAIAVSSKRGTTMFTVLGLEHLRKKGDRTSLTKDFHAEVSLTIFLMVL